MSKKLLSDYIKMYDGTLTSEQCRALIDRFEASPDQHESKQRNIGTDNSYSFTQLNISRHWPDAVPLLGHVMRTCLTQYHQSLNIGRFWPHNPTSENIRLKRYVPGGQDGFAPHVDVMDQTASYRMVTAILYLNVPGGGETVFPDLDVTIPPAVGRVVVFPPLWTFVHAGLPPRDGPKYIVHSYLWYPPRAPSANEV